MHAETPSLNDPFDHAAVIEGTLLAAFPRVWDGVYYFDPRRGRAAIEESAAVYNLIRSDHKDINLRNLQNFGREVAVAIRHGSGLTIPFSGRRGRIACYLMTERDKDAARLTRFFGDAALDTRDLGRTGRLFEEYVARHEVYHSVEMLEPGFHIGKCSLRESEGGADSFSLMGMFRRYGEPVGGFSSLVIAARDHQCARDRKSDPNSAEQYTTQAAIRATLEFANEQGIKALQAMSEHDVFRKAQQFGAYGALTAR